MKAVFILFVLFITNSYAQGLTTNYLICKDVDLTKPSAVAGKNITMELKLKEPIVLQRNGGEEKVVEALMSYSMYSGAAVVTDELITMAQTSDGLFGAQFTYNEYTNFIYLQPIVRANGEQYYYGVATIIYSEDLWIKVNGTFSFNCEVQ